MIVFILFFDELAAMPAVPSALRAALATIPRLDLPDLAYQEVLNQFANIL